MDKVLFGSDSPFSHPKLEVEKIGLLTTPEQRRAVCWTNGARLLGL